MVLTHVFRWLFVAVCVILTSYPVLGRRDLLKRTKRGKGDWTLIWRDEFNFFDTNKWEHQYEDGCHIGVCQWGNKEQVSDRYVEKLASPCPYPVATFVSNIPTIISCSLGILIQIPWCAEAGCASKPVKKRGSCAAGFSKTAGTIVGTCAPKRDWLETSFRDVSKIVAPKDVPKLVSPRLEYEPLENSALPPVMHTRW